MDKDYTQQIQQNQILLEKTASIVCGQLDLWNEQLCRLENIVQPLNQSSKKTFIFQQNLFKLKEVADKLQEIEVENTKLSIYLKKAYNSTQLKYFKQLNANIEYIRSKHPDYSVAKHEQTMKDFTQQILQRIKYLADQFVTKNDFESIRDLSSANLLLISQQVKEVKSNRTMSQYGYFRTSCFTQFDSYLQELSGIVRVFFLSHRQFVQVITSIQRDFGERFYWLIHSFQIFRDLVVLSEQYNERKYPDQNDGHINNMVTMSIYFQILKAIGLDPNVHSNIPQNQTELQNIMKQRSTFTEDFMTKRKIFNTKAHKIHIDEEKYKEMAYQTERGPLTAIFMVLQAKIFQISELIRNTVRQCVSEVLVGAQEPKSSQITTKTSDDNEKLQQSSSNNQINDKIKTDKLKVQDKNLFSEQIELPEALEHLVLKFSQHVVASMIYPAMENYFQLISEYCWYGEKYRIRRSVYGMLDIVQILGVTVPVFINKLYPNITDYNSPGLYSKQVRDEQGNDNSGNQQNEISQQNKVESLDNKSKREVLGNQSVMIGQDILNMLRRQPDTIGFSQLGSYVSIGKSHLQIIPGTSYILLLVSNIISNVTKSAVILQDNIDMTLFPASYKPPADTFVIPQITTTVNLLFQLSYYTQGQKILAEMIGLEKVEESEHKISTGTSIQSLGTKGNLQSATNVTTTTSAQVDDQQSPWKLPAIFKFRGTYYPVEDNIMECRLYRLVCYALMIGINPQVFNKQKNEKSKQQSAAPESAENYENIQNQDGKNGEKPIYNPQQLLQRINTISYIQDTLTMQGGVLASAISSQFKLEFLESIINKLLQMYVKQLLSVCTKELKVQTLCVAIEHVYKQWANKRRYGVDSAQVQQILAQLSSYRVQRDNLQLKQKQITENKTTSVQRLDDLDKMNYVNAKNSQNSLQQPKNVMARGENQEAYDYIAAQPDIDFDGSDMERSLPSELSDDSAITGIDMDQVTESNFSQFGTVPEHFQVQGQKIVSKRIKGVIDQSIDRFRGALKALKAAHNGFECVSPTLRVKMRKILTEKLGNQLELFQNACYTAPVAQRYFELQGFSLPQLQDFIDTLL